MIFPLLLACAGSVSEDNWPERYAKEACKAYESCTRLYFSEYFSDLDDCIDTFADELEDETHEGCVFDAEQANECLDALKSFTDTCEYREIDDECGGVWMCPDRPQPHDTGRDTGRFRGAGCTSPFASWGGLSFTLFFFAPWMRRRRSP